MSSIEKELEDQLVQIGNNLLKPPPSADELLPLLDQVETFLTKVEQSPSTSMQNAISPVTKALVANELLRHSDTDVKVSIASCISEITRITAPEAPYDDDQMKEIFQLIVASFEKLSETSNRSYRKRVTILETVAKVRSCVVMLDLECDSLILEMFHHFLNVIRDDHPESVFSAMEMIMSLVLEESEDISPEIISPLLTSVKKSSQDVLPITRKLAETVLTKCASKLKPYLMQTVKSMGMSLDDYSEVISAICQETSDKVEHDDESVSDEHMEIESKLLEKIVSDEPQVTKEMEVEPTCPGELDPLVNESTKLNGVSKTEDDDSLLAMTSPEKKLELPQHTSNSSKAESDSLDPKTLKSKAKPDRVSKKKREHRKHNSSMQSIESSDHPRIDSDKEDMELLDGGKSRSKVTSNSLPEGLSVGEPAEHSGHGKETPTKLSSPTASHDDALKIASPSRSQSLPDGTRSKGDQGGPNKEEKINRDSDLGLSAESKHDLLCDQIKEEAPPSADILKKESEGNSKSEARPYKRSGKKAHSKKTDMDNSAHQTDSISSPKSEPKVKPLKHSVEKADSSDTEDDPSVKNLGGKAKKERGKPISQKDMIGETSPKSSLKLVNKHQGVLEATPKSKSKRKRTPAKEEASGKSSSVEEPDEKMVGSRIKVWWPKDHTFYEGVVESYDPIKKKHKVVYVDGDIEVLKLIKQRWELVEGNSEPDEGKTTDLPTQEQIDEKPQKKKVKTTSESSTKPARTDASLKRGKGTSTSKSNMEATNSSDEFKDDDKLISKTKEQKTKGESAGKSEETTTKTGSKSKEATNSSDELKDDDKLISKTKEIIPKTARRTKGESAGKSEEKTTKTGSKSKEATNSDDEMEDDDKLISKTKEIIPKTARRTKGESAGKLQKTTKTGSKSKEATNSDDEMVDDDKLISKAKEIIPKTARRTKGESAGKSEEKTTKTASKSKEATNSDDEMKDDDKLISKTKEIIPKSARRTKSESAGKSEETTTKTGSKLKESTSKMGSNSKDDTPKTSTKSKNESDGKSGENTTKTKTVSKSKDATLKLDSKLKADTPKTSTKDESAGESEENTNKTKGGSKSKDATVKLGSQSKDDTRKASTKSKDESAGESEENSNKTKTGSKLKDGAAKLDSKSKDQSAGKSKESTSKTSSKSRDSTPKLASKTKDDDVPKTSSKSKSETPKTGKKSASTNGNSSKGNSDSSKVQESEDLGKEKLVDSAKASQQESDTKSGKKRRRR